MMRPIYNRFRKKLAVLVSSNATSRYLLAVSGGLDSMVLWDLFEQSGLDYGIAHCNFQLRGKDADGDEAFVKKQAAQLDRPCFTIRLDTRAFAQKQKCSIQEAARTLRYEWLEERRTEQNYDYVVTAHQADDNLETVLYQLTKGTGLKGLLGIPAINQNIIRPLLTFPRETLQIYYNSRQLSHREDSSNAEDYYSRNKIRHHVIPILESINPGLLQTFERTLNHLSDSYFLFQEQVSFWKKQVWTKEDAQIKVDLAPIENHPALATLLYEWFKDFQFHPDQFSQLISSISNQQVGIIIESQTHQLLLDRATLLVKKRTTEQQKEYIIIQHPSLVLLPEGQLQLSLKNGKPPHFSADANLAYLDAAKLKLPLKLRRWQAGDRFSPLGMPQQHKKVQDLFSDRKISRFEKEKIWILVDKTDQICWIVGLQMDDRFKIVDTTTQYYEINYKKRDD